MCSEDFWGVNKNGALNGLGSDLWNPRVPWSHIVHSGYNETKFHSDKSSEKAESDKDAAQKVKETHCRRFNFEQFESLRSLTSDS